MSSSDSNKPLGNKNEVEVIVDFGELGRITSHNIDVFLSSDAIDALTAIASSK